MVCEAVIMPAVARPLTDFPLFTPPQRRWAGSIVDAHMHARDLASIDPYWAIAEQPYGVRYAVPIVDLNTGLELRAKFGARVQPAIWGIQPRTEKLAQSGKWSEIRKLSSRLVSVPCSAGRKSKLPPSPW